MKALVTVITLATLSTGALAEEVQPQPKPFGNATPFVGASLGLVNYTEGLGYGSEIEANLTMLSVRGGVKFNQYASAELRLGTSSADSVYVYGVPVDVRVQNYIGGYIKGHLPINEQVNIYGLVGLTSATVAADAGYGEVSESESDTSYGLGAEFWQAGNKKGRLGGSVEYINYYDDQGATVDSLEFSVLVAF